MIGPILVLVSWLLLRFERKPLSVLGFDLPLRRALEFGLGLCLAALFAAAKYSLQGFWKGVSWEWNPSITLAAVAEGVRWTTNSVLYEELLFRGYLLYQAIRFLGVRKGCGLSALTFGVYHWFSYGVFGSVMPMIYVFLLTAAFGLMLAVAFAKSGSVALPIGLHLGWNLVSIVIFSDGPIGPQLLMPSGAPDLAPSVAQSVTTGLIVPLLFPAVTIWALLRKRTRASDSASAEARAEANGGEPNG